MPTVFSMIASGEIPSYKVAEDDKHFAFLDINPVAPGHVLVIPKREVDYIFDLDNDELAALHLFAKKVAVAMKKAIRCRKIGMAVIGLEVPHAHIHLVPMETEADMNFHRPKLSLPAERMTEIAQSISAFIKSEQA
ncbi:MAG: HIT family protein [Muribaculaceae bacterium]|nr:HIT family protein [Muribaculaceae bacterium]